MLDDYATHAILDEGPNTHRCHETAWQAGKYYRGKNKFIRQIKELLNSLLSTTDALLLH